MVGRRIPDPEMAAPGARVIGAEIDGLLPRLGGVHHIVVVRAVRIPGHDRAVLHLHGLELVPGVERAQEKPLHPGGRVVGFPGEAVRLAGRPAVHGTDQEIAGERVVLGLIRDRLRLRRRLSLRQRRRRQKRQQHQKSQQRGQQTFSVHTITSLKSFRKGAPHERNTALPFARDSLFHLSRTGSAGKLFKKMVPL